MSKVQMLRSFVNQRLTAAAEEIFGLFERTIAEYEEELYRSNEENERQRKLLDAVFNPQLRLHRADVQQQKWSSILDQEDPEPPHIKEEQEELWTSQEGEQLQKLEEADVKFSFTPVKSEDDEEEAQSSELHKRQTKWIETEADGEDCGGPEPGRNSVPDIHPGPDTDGKTGDSSEPETDDSDDWKEIRELQSGLNSLKPDEVPVSDLRCTGDKPFCCSDCVKTFGTRVKLKRHMRIHTGEKPYSCSVCKKSFTRSHHLQMHMKTHSGVKPFSCSVCGKCFIVTEALKKHIRTHTGEKPYSCSVCKKSFSQSGTLTLHMRIHTGEKPYSCSVCKKSFAQSHHLQIHMKAHRGEKPFSCSVCGKCFIEKGALKNHMRSHTGEKPFSCSVCKKCFTRKENLQKHTIIHTRENRSIKLEETNT